MMESHLSVSTIQDGPSVRSQRVESRFNHNVQIEACWILYAEK